MFKHVFNHTFKVLLRRKGLLFWSLIFPIILGVLFKLALGNIMDEIALEPIPVSVEENLYKDENINKFFKMMEDEEIFKVTKHSGEDLLETDKVEAHIIDKDNIIVKSNSLESSVVSTVMRNYVHNEKTIMNILQNNPQADLSKFFENKDFIEDKSNKNMNMVNTYFYTLLGMQALYGYMWGMSVINQYHANLSTVAKRNTVAPSKVKTRLLSAISVAWIINMVVLIITVLVLKFMLNVDFSERFIYLIPMLMLAALCGVAFGTMLGTVIKGDSNKKENLGISITMAMSFLAGMMVSDIKIMIQRSMPLLNKLNPVALITDTLYSLYYYTDLSRYYENMLWLLLVTIIFIAVTAIMTRGKRYEHL